MFSKNIAFYRKSVHLMGPEVRVGSEKPNQDKTGQDTARLDKTRQDKSEFWRIWECKLRGKREPPKRGQDRRRQVKAREDKTKTRESIEEKKKEGGGLPRYEGKGPHRASKSSGRAVP